MTEEIREREATGTGPGGIDTTVATPARIYDYFLGGKDNYAVDRQAAEEIMKAVPEAPAAALANRAFLRRAVRFMAEAGIRQFLDVGAGLPTQGNVHEVAQEIRPESRIVYVDNDPVVLVHGRALLEANSDVAVVRGDLRRPEEILAEPRLNELIDLDEPVGVLLIAILHFIGDEENPFDLVARLMERLPPGSHLAISHGYEGGMADGTSEHAQGVYRRSTSAIHSRNPRTVERFFTGTDIVEPGVVWVPQWRAEEAAAEPERTHFLGAVGRKP
ncbi:SAM-dependent methyltransferase [Actinomadura sp. WAC 06369]|uniref:SAM-dependent methyltransferase n=1 Tax=Actinomadura sp. WAC 06369 TaxID=2203193 RepID=UPI001F30944D|nr:SAM-dependent methyltransferase [Actinomadura sp. WAC 06369]